MPDPNALGNALEAKRRREQAAEGAVKVVERLEPDQLEKVATMTPEELGELIDSVEGA